MSWRFWQPKHTLENVAKQLADGFRDGSVILDEPLDGDDDVESDTILMQLDVAQGMTDTAILDMVKQCASSADEENRRQGGLGLRIGRVVIEVAKVKVALRPRIEIKQTDLV
jgi:hypothetical protein